MAPGVIIANDMYPGPQFEDRPLVGPTIKRGAQIGCNCTLRPGVVIGEYSLIGAGSVVTKDIPPRQPRLWQTRRAWSRASMRS